MGRPHKNDEPARPRNIVNMLGLPQYQSQQDSPVLQQHTVLQYHFGNQQPSAAAVTVTMSMSESSKRPALTWRMSRTVIRTSGHALTAAVLSAKGEVERGLPQEGCK